MSSEEAMRAVSVADVADQVPEVAGEVVGSGELATSDAERVEARRQKVKSAAVYVWCIIGICVLTGVLIYLLNILSAPVSMLIWTLIFVFCLRGIVNKLQEKGVNRGLGTAIAYAIMFAVLGGIGLLMFSPMFGLNAQFMNIIESMPGYFDQASKWANDVYGRYSDLLGNDTVQHLVQEATSSVTGAASSFASNAANTVMGIGGIIANGAMAIGFALVVAFWILMELPSIGREAKRVISPKHYEDARFLHVAFTRIMGGYIKGTLIQCLIIGAACGILFVAVGVPNAPALGVITGTLNIIPIVGPWLGGAAAAVSAIFVSPLTALIALIGTILIQQVVYTFISPKIMSNSVDIHPALTLVAMMCGSAIGGAMNGLLGSLVGMLFAIPLVAVLKACFVYYFEKQTQRRVVSRDGVFFKGTPAPDEKVDPFFDATSPSLDRVPKKKRKLPWKRS